MNYYPNLNNDFIGATGEYPITDYINITSNILNSNITITSNTNYNYTSNSCNILRNELWNINPNNSNVLINTKITTDFISQIGLIDVVNTYIYNNYIYGEIRFKIKNDNSYFVKIGKDGKLYLWISYYILRPEILAGWYEVSDILADYFFNLAIINLALTAIGADTAYLQGQINTITYQITAIIDLTAVHTVQINELIALQPESLVSEYLNSTMLNPTEISNNIIARGINSVSRLGTGSRSLIGFGGFGFLTYLALGTYGYFSQLAEDRQEQKIRLLNIYGSLLTNSNLSNLEVIDSNNPINPSNTIKNNLFSNIYSNLSNINNDEIIYKTNMIKSLGFINCNIQTRQFIPSLNTNEIFINNININSNLNTTSNSLFNYTNITSNANYNNSLNNYNTLNTKINNSSNDNYNFNITNSNQIYNNYNSLRGTDEMILSILDSDYCKKSTFLISTNNLINYNSVNYYTYTIDLTKYIRYIQISDITKLSRFKIMASLASSVAVFSYLTECEYTIMMSQSTSIGQTGGFHCRAFGIPDDLNLTKFSPYKFIKTNNIYQLSFISPVQYAKFIITIIDLF
jgi:hypothetical protein